MHKGITANTTTVYYKICLIVIKIKHECPKNMFRCHISKYNFLFSLFRHVLDSFHEIRPWLILSYRTLSAESLNEILLLSVSIQFLLILEVIADRLTSPSRICRSITEVWDFLINGPLNFCDKFLHAVEVRSFYRHQIPPLADSDVNKSHHLPHLSIKKNTEFTFMHLADAFIQSDLHCIQVTVFTFDQLLLSLGIKPMILALLAPCTTIWATGKL